MDQMENNQEQLNNDNINQDNLFNTDSKDLRKYNLFFIIQLTSITAIGGLLFGYDTGVIAGANLYLVDSFPDITDLQKETVVSMALVGAAISSLAGGPISDKFGRKITVILADILFTLGAILMAISWNVGFLIFGRFIVGCGVGLAAMIVPIYLAECSPAEIRGKLVTTNTVFLTSGQFFAILICLALGHQWRIMLGLAGIPSIIQFFGILTMPESPSWLLSKNRDEEARKAVNQIYGAVTEQDIRFAILKQESENIKIESMHPFSTQCKTLFTQYGRCIFIGVMLQVWQQLCGINTAMYYGPEILKKSFDQDDEDDQSDKALLYSLPLAAINAVGTVVAVFFIDKLGRRFVMLRSLPFIAISMFLIGIGFYVHNYVDGKNDLTGTWMIFSFILTYLAFFSVGMGNAPWTVNSEIYPLHLRGVGNSIATFANWVSNAALAQIFLTSTESQLGQVITFSSIGFVCICAFIFIYKFVPETKGKTLEQVLQLITQNGIDPNLISKKNSEINNDENEDYNFNYQQ